MTTDAQEKILPVHVGLILDGNRRWAVGAGLPRLEGHRRGYERFREIAQAAKARGVKYLSAYVFSTENWNRSQEEVDYLMDLLVWIATKEIDKYRDDGLRVRFAGSRDGLPQKVRQAIEYAEAKTADNRDAECIMCLNYGGHLEVVEAVRQLAMQGVDMRQVTEDQLSQAMYVPDVPPVDLVIRTSGEQRASGFMMWRTTYAEWVYSPKYWPDFTADDLDEALEEYTGRKRRFGK